MKPDSKLPQVGTTIFAVMSQLAQQHQAINLGQGFPDFDCDPALQALVCKALHDGHNQYAPMTGVPALRTALSQKYQHLHGRRYDPDTEITVTAGATQALMAAILAIVRTGDEVIVLEPVYDSYIPSILLAGGIPVPVRLREADYSVPWDEVRAAVTPRTRLLIVNSPHNPSGAVFTAADLDAVEELVAGTGIWLLSDEVYEHIVFDDAAHLSLAGRPALAERCFVVSSFGKTFHATGWKVGYCCAPAAMSAELRKVHQFMVYAVSTPVQHALAAWLEDPSHYEALPAFYQAKRDRFRSGLAGSRFRLLPCAGTYFQLADYSAISSETETAFARRLTIEHGVAAIPAAVFYDPPVERQVVRFCFAKRDDTLDAALERLQRIG